MPAGVRVLEASLLRHYPARRHRVLLPGRPGQVHRTRHPRRRRLDAQPAGRDVRRRRLHVDFRRVEAADQLALLDGDVRRHQGATPTAGTSRSSWAAPAAGRSRRPTPGKSSSVDCVVEGRSESADMLKLFDKAIARRGAAAQLDVGHPKDRDEILLPRQAHDVRRGRDDDRLRTALPVLRARSQSADRHAEGQDHGGGPRRTSATATSRSRWRPRTCSSGARSTPRRRSTSRTAKRCSTSTGRSSTRPASSSTS